VVEGTLQADGIHGDKVITRCASKYQPADTMAGRDESPAK
jgi:cytochrome c-type biogenesis protein CcmE